MSDRKKKRKNTVSCSSGLVKTILQDTVKGGRSQGRQMKRWEDNIREWTGLQIAKFQRAVENREKWMKLVVKSSLEPQRPSQWRYSWWHVVMTTEQLTKLAMMPVSLTPTIRYTVTDIFHGVKKKPKLCCRLQGLAHALFFALLFLPLLRSGKLWYQSPPLQSSGGTVRVSLNTIILIVVQSDSPAVQGLIHLVTHQQSDVPL